jgi:hypothetical protein
LIYFQWGRILTIETEGRQRAAPQTKVAPRGGNLRGRDQSCYGGSEAGIGDDRERGTIDTIDGDRVTVRWDSEIVTTQPIEALDDLTVL